MQADEYTELWGTTLDVQANIEPVDYESIKAAGGPKWMAKEVDDSGSSVGSGAGIGVNLM